jgi:hypothetical protein
MKFEWWDILAGWLYTDFFLGLYQPEYVALDWITGNIYFTDYEAKHIGVCTNNGTLCTILVNKDMDKPRGMTVLPIDG